MIRYYESPEAEAKFDRRVRRLIWFGIACVLAGTVITHYWH